jgi:tetratricopeptide (TPR) repeat protein
MGFETFRKEMRQRRGSLSLRALGRELHYDHSMLSRVESGRQAPSPALASALDEHFGTNGMFLGFIQEIYPRVGRLDSWEGFEIMRRINASDIGPGQIEQLERAVYELCCEYPYASTERLRSDTIDVLRLIAQVRERSKLNLLQHRDILVTAGWASLLLGCVEYDLGLRPQAEASRLSALSIGQETAHGELVAWAHEMRCWFALTRSAWQEVIEHAEAGRQSAGSSSVAAQLWAHQARAVARLGDRQELARALERGRNVLAALPRAERPEHHFIIDPDKWDFYAMDAYTIVGATERATQHAQEVIRTSRRPDGTDRWPMRSSNAMFRLGVLATRQGDLDGAIHHARQAFGIERRSLPSLIASARELGRELEAAFPGERALTDYRELVAAAQAADSPAS